ncbi:MAG: ABC transporter permease [Ilumatobacter sp.]|uniref:ABC transporter permease n=1 Tax=Ilumatobacter sp. TaxID=1967498 RepID=UPI0026099B12|nr:ABC transporter permease [Ilumatobacter sp.]MDJ0767243.1 ABC transporter permease [Ilumatobacter sp.]
MSARATRLVIERELREALRRKGVWALIALTFLGSTALVLAPELIPDDDNNRVMVVGPDTLGVVAALESTPVRDLEVSTGIDRRDGAEAIANRDADMAVILGGHPNLLVEDEDSDLVVIVREIVADRVVTARLTDEGIDPARVNAAFVAAVPEVEPIEPEREAREGAAFGVTMMLYILIVILSSQVAGAVAVEKSNRVSEVLLAIVPPRSLLFGKVIGVGCIGLLTLIAGTTPVIVRLLAGGDLPEDLGRTIVASSIWFVAGLALYLTVAGALGALVARQEETGVVVLPLTLFLILGYALAITAGDSTLGAVLAYIPLLSPMVEPYRIAIGAGSPIEYGASILLLIAAVVLASRVGAVVFRRAIVSTGRRLKLREALAGTD